MEKTLRLESKKAGVKLTYRHWKGSESYQAGIYKAAPALASQAARGKSERAREIRSVRLQRPVPSELLKNRERVVGFALRGLQAQRN